MEPGNFKDSIQSSVQWEILEQHPGQEGIRSQMSDTSLMVDQPQAELTDMLVSLESAEMLLPGTVACRSVRSESDLPARKEHGMMAQNRSLAVAATSFTEHCTIWESLQVWSLATGRSAACVCAFMPG